MKTVVEANRGAGWLLRQTFLHARFSKRGSDPDGRLGAMAAAQKAASDWHHNAPHLGEVRVRELLA